MVDLQLSDLPRITKSQLCKVAIAGTHLHQWQGKGIEGLRKTFRAQGFVQLDPINPAGRNHDFFFFSRIPDYRRGDFEREIYPKGEVFENYFHLLNAISREHFHLFYPQRKEENLGRYYLEPMEKYKKTSPGLIQQVYTYVEKNGPVSNKDILHFGKQVQGVKWKRNSGASILEILWATGKLAVVGRDDMFQKQYDLTLNRFRAEELKDIDSINENLWFQRLKLHIRSFPVTDSRIAITKTKKLTLSRAKDAWTKRIGNHLASMNSEKASPSSELANPILVYCQELNRIYIVPHDWKKLARVKIDDEIRIIAPLDPLIWDRKFLREAFNFDYVWEIYKPAKDRKWGYYVLPLLYKGKFIGRLEGTMKKQDKVLKVFNILPEPGVKYFDELKAKITELLEHWQKMAGAKSLQVTW